MSTVLELNKHNASLILGGAKASSSTSSLAALSILSDKLGQTLELTSAHEKVVAPTDEFQFVDQDQLNEVFAALREKLTGSAKSIFSEVLTSFIAASSGSSSLGSTATTSTSATTPSTTPAATSTTDSSSPSMSSVWEMERWVNILQQKLNESYAERSEQNQQIVDSNMDNLRTENQQDQEKYNQDHTHHSFWWKLTHALKDIVEAVVLIATGVDAGVAEVTSIVLDKMGLHKEADFFSKAVDAYLTVFNDMKDDPELGDVIKGLEYVGMAMMVLMSVFDPALLVFAIVMITLSETDGLGKLSEAIADSAGMPKWAADLIVMAMVTVVTMGVGTLSAVEVGGAAAAEELEGIELDNLAENGVEENLRDNPPPKQNSANKYKVGLSQGLGTGIGSMTMVDLPTDIAKAAGGKAWMIILANILGLLIALVAMGAGSAGAKAFAPEEETLASRLTGKSPFPKAAEEYMMPLMKGITVLSEMAKGEMQIGEAVATYEKGEMIQHFGSIEAEIALINATLQATNTTIENDQAWVKKMTDAYANEVSNFGVFGLPYQAASEVHV